ncbi:hypothetical protein MKW92_039345 [Papaver armeniacum]|nr:hypothetical protein MKW92_039345 [Papaver armeniacum]
MAHWNQSAFAGRLDFRLQVQGVSGSWLSKENRIGVMVHSGRTEVMDSSLARWCKTYQIRYSPYVALSNRVYKVPFILPALIVNHVPNRVQICAPL